MLRESAYANQLTPGLYFSLISMNHLLSIDIKLELAEKRTEEKMEINDCLNELRELTLSKREEAEAECEAVSDF